MELSRGVIILSIFAFFVGGAIFGGTIGATIVFLTQENCEKGSHHGTHQEGMMDIQTQLKQCLSTVEGAQHGLGLKMDTGLKGLSDDMKDFMEKIKDNQEARLVTVASTTTVPPVGRKR